MDIKGNGTPNPPYGGSVNTATFSNVGFAAKVAYWEVMVRLPAQKAWSNFWLYGKDPVTGISTEVDSCEFGYQVPGTTNGSFQIDFHTSAGVDGRVVGPPLAVTLVAGTL